MISGLFLLVLLLHVLVVPIEMPLTPEAARGGLHHAQNEAAAANGKVDLFPPEEIADLIPAPTEEFVYRPLQLGDYEKHYLELLRDLTEAPEVSKETWRRQFERMVVQPHAYFVIVVEDVQKKRIAASITLLLEWKFIRSAAVRGRIEDVVVHHDYRSKGFAKRLFEIAVELAKRKDVYKLSLDCKDNLVPFYEKFGLVKEGNNMNDVTKSARNPVVVGMGNEQSQAGPSAPTSSSSFSFLNRKSTRSSQKTHSPVVVANQRRTDPNEDENLKKLREIPRFQPLLKGVLPGQRDPPGVFQKIDPKHISRFVHRLQIHFAACHRAVGAEQTALCTKITEVDTTTSDVFKRTSIHAKKYETLTADLKRIQTLESNLDSLQTLLEDVTRGLQTLNELLPDDQRLPLLPLFCAPKTKQIEE
ncbi:BLOC-1-related complex subunit 5 [Aphelenchoides fujianensis]|nr:BLOC-1-related complex subunit 5 [Aphelenchoides fujianensis]